jgi:hypothetical protein
MSRTAFNLREEAQLKLLLDRIGHELTLTEDRLEATVANCVITKYQRGYCRITYYRIGNLRYGSLAETVAAIPLRSNVDETPKDSA